MIASQNDTTHARLTVASTNAAVDNTGPGAVWATGNLVNISGCYEAA